MRKSSISSVETAKGVLLAYVYSDILSGICSEILCGWGPPAGNTLIRSSQLRSCGEHFDPELAVEVRRGTLRSSACGWGPAGKILPQRLLGGNATILERAVEARRGSLWSFGSGGEHCDLELAVGDHSDPGVAVRVRRGALRSRVYSLQLRSGERGGGQGAGGGGGLASLHKI